MVDARLFERLRFWGLMVMLVTVVAFLAVMVLSMVFGLGINGISTLPIFSLLLIGLAIVFVGGFTIQIYGSVRIWLRRGVVS